jgi:hypothetical protein
MVLAVAVLDFRCLFLCRRFKAPCGRDASSCVIYRPIDLSSQWGEIQFADGFVGQPYHALSQDSMPCIYTLCIIFWVYIYEYNY